MTSCNVFIDKLPYRLKWYIFFDPIYDENLSFFLNKISHSFTTQQSETLKSKMKNYTLLLKEQERNIIKVIKL